MLYNQKIDLKTVYKEWLEERRKRGMKPLSSDVHIHIMALIERFETAERKIGDEVVLQSKPKD